MSDRETSAGIAGDDVTTGERPSGGSDLPVIFVAGKGRSGSTVLSMVLGELPGVTNGGELRLLWQRGLVEHRNCGCGQAFPGCPLWAETIDRLRAADPELDGEVMAAVHDKVLRWPAVPRFLAGRRGTNGWSDLDRWVSGVGNLYRSLADTTDAEVVVDSSKWPADPAMLGLVPGIRPIIVHLVRDPRAVAWSWQRRRKQFDRAEEREMDRFGPWHSSTSWVARNLVVDAMARRWSVPRIVMRYEDFVADPRAAVRRIADLASVPLAPDGVIDGRTVQRSVNHTVAGNPARFATGPLELRPDDEWRAALPRRQRLTITTLTAPLLRRYGYPLRVRSDT